MSALMKKIWIANSDAASYDVQAAADDINLSLMAQDISTWAASDYLAERTAVRDAERQIAQCHTDIAPYLRIEIEDFVSDENA